MRCPCRGCEERYEACHDHCARYQEWAQARREIYAERAMAVRLAKDTGARARRIREWMMQRKSGH